MKKIFACLCLSIGLLGLTGSTVFSDNAIVPEKTDAAEATKVMIILAHPDDDFMLNGAIAMLADKGYDVQMVYATSGDAGLDVSGQKLRGQALAKVRELETADALKILGVVKAPIYLHLQDGKLTASRKELAQKLTELIAELKPSMVITFGPDGVTGHPDHIAVCSATTAAFDDQKSNSCKTLLNFAVSTKRTSVLKTCSTVDYVENFFEGVDPSAVNLVVDTAPYQQKRIDALFTYNTQFNQNYRTGWVKFVDQCPYEEFVVARIKGSIKSISSFNDLIKGANRL
jgi:LmbE family N-acetylglucosaminyl deacetylase